MSISDYNNNRISEDELKLKFKELKSKLTEVYVIPSLFDRDSKPLPTEEYFDWRLPKDVIDLKQYRQSFDNKLKMVG